MDAAPLTVGTAGHIDHGKTALVRALTGRDTDRLAEERRRGMSIELGFAPLELGDRRLSLIDVPGHERFVRTMIAGAGGIDLFVLVVAADDGPMPQTLEHLRVLEALGVEAGVVALTKVDLVDAERRRTAASECTALMPAAPLVEVSAPRGEGVEELRAALVAVTASIDHGGAPDEEVEPVLHVDRSFTVTGHGTVVTGTLRSGMLERGRRVTVLPEGREARVRSIEVHDTAVDRAAAHQRVALNLGGVGPDEVRRGDVITIPGGAVAPTHRIDADLTLGAAEIVAERRVQVHLGTREAPARVVDLGASAAQFRLEAPLLARLGDRLVVRRIAPPGTLGGGTVRDPSPPRRGSGRSSRPDERAGTVEIRRSAAPRRRQARVEEETGPTKAAGPSELARVLLAELEAGGDRPPGVADLAERAGADRREAERALGELVAAGAAVRLKPGVVYTPAAFERLRDRVLVLVRERGSASIAEVRDELGLSRRYALALLE
ncbi:MAG: selenocysteine-specific translation elongation factor, partial [Actinobacteria bacterium]|nr:selenocysteine-specific translation elongation factor [Actinomycetota bacterium]